MSPIDRLSQIKSRFKWRSNYTDIHTLSLFFMSRRGISVDSSSDKGLLFVNSKYLSEFEAFYHNPLTRPLNATPTIKNLKLLKKKSAQSCISNTDLEYVYAFLCTLHSTPFIVHVNLCVSLKKKIRLSR